VLYSILDKPVSIYSLYFTFFILFSFHLVMSVCLFGLFCILAVNVFSYVKSTILPFHLGRILFWEYGGLCFSTHGRNGSPSYQSIDFWGYCRVLACSSLSVL